MVDLPYSIEVPAVGGMERRPWPSWGPQALLCFWLARCACGIGVNWGTQASHPLPPSTAVEMLRASGIDKVKLFDAEAAPLSALANSGIQVMVGIPNGMLAGLAAEEKAARRWVAKNVSDYVDDGVDVRLRFSPFDRLFQYNSARSLRTIYSAMADTSPWGTSHSWRRTMKATSPPPYRRSKTSKQPSLRQG